MLQTVFGAGWVEASPSNSVWLRVILEEVSSSLSTGHVGARREGGKGIKFMVEGRGRG